MRKVQVLVHGIKAAILEELSGQKYRLTYFDEYKGPPVSLVLPIVNKTYDFDLFPHFFEGLLPEGVMLEALLRKYKLDGNDYFGQIIVVGKDVVGAVTIEEIS